jgi:hypothetical protein
VRKRPLPQSIQAALNATTAPRPSPPPVELPKEWERQPAESQEAWLAFRAYRDMPPENRLLSRTAARATETLSRWYRDHNWASRVLAYDKEFDSISVEERKKAFAMAARDVALEHMLILADARELVQREVQKLVMASRDGDAPGLMRPAEVRKLLETTVKLDRLVRGDTTENVGVKDSVDVSKLTIDEVRQLEKLMRKAGAAGEE